MNILVLDDEAEIANLVELFLKNEGYTIFKFYNSKDAIQCIESNHIDLAMLDVMLPDTDGFTILRKIREKGLTFPVIMLTAKVEDYDKIMGLSLGADDYITKPFNPLEMVSRVKAQIRRSTYYNNNGRAQENIFDSAGLVVNNDTHQCTLYEKPIALTPIEFKILWLLCENADKVVSTEEIFEKVWGEKYLDCNNTVMVHIRRIREKMNEPSRNPKFIKTVWGVGYKIEKK
ncbi:MAG: VanR-ABDEGLN family response regulator transcription factor [Acetobacter sp.]|nr:VanR-ABDEGLN family response regulator transcription factor [Bacteroides sp.]MCM1341313.1 VanR-ABDEGLN family response regulator transcription factor [Acetobacter sp.]MCM1433911.1 VanR-ABDEGLN family response regulator transcription factor [Clostridiales bacterium]